MTPRWMPAGITALTLIMAGCSGSSDGAHTVHFNG